MNRSESHGTPADHDHPYSHFHPFIGAQGHGPCGNQRFKPNGIVRHKARNPILGLRDNHVLLHPSLKPQRFQPQIRMADITAPLSILPPLATGACLFRGVGSGAHS
ncbi:uncharacterized protein BO96DRAFT_348372 [Aspergillus niger CBS 101883]|uniref:Contig An04c0270, genomic contig n=2 Tax=Aspergillus niger TaxID=5061 RepID=A2QJV0_ASPNC|nr:uncharacterized protein BO96DRAFT_348372 [Aspergillus niger CBS 101883]XP_059600647.1 uncharacterized protein An04g08350 [Aspergillus niger]PYH52186.1 hypothetical protein BO96DRAFT_348372 [Aspergillus niger CBS 101883]CAK38922.1 unnamed protein product [Aspergillus niger]